MNSNALWYVKEARLNTPNTVYSKILVNSHFVNNMQNKTKWYLLRFY